MAPSVLPAGDGDDYLSRHDWERALQARGTATGRVFGWQRRYIRRLRALDGAIVVLAVLGSQWLRYGVGPRSMGMTLADGSVARISYYLVSGVIVAGWYLALSFGRTRDEDVIGIGVDEYRRILTATFVLFGLVAIVSLIGHMQLSRIYIFLALPGGLCLLVVGRWLLRAWLTRRRGHGGYMHTAVLLGYTHTFPSILADINRHVAIVYRVVGALGLDAATPSELAPGVPCRPADQANLIEGIDPGEVDTVIYTGGGPSDPQALREFAWQLQRWGMTLILAPSSIDFVGPRTRMRRLAGLPLVYAEYPSLSEAELIVKRAIDIVGAVVLGVVFSPLMLVMAVAIKATSPGPVIYRQPRVGVRGRPFVMYKFRSMHLGAEKHQAALTDETDGGGRRFKARDDPRRTGVGRFMRRFSVDELPQLWNVLRNDMALVGPRPPLEKEVAAYTQHDRHRLMVKPGMTGLWQINGRADLSWDDSIRFDLDYVENWSVLGDLQILLRTARAVVKGRGAY